MPTAIYLCISYWLTHFVYLTCRFDYPDKAYLYRDGVNHKPGYVNPDKDRPANLIGTGKLTIEKGLQVNQVSLPNLDVTGELKMIRYWPLNQLWECETWLFQIGKSV